ncbi:MAG: FxLYD domain-containing protein [Thermoanaerobaculia bacterium]|nr:FxLYD domain-containing protein [Thermoanaerobaculia bacterium]
MLPAAAFLLAAQVSSSTPAATPTATPSAVVTPSAPAPVPTATPVAAADPYRPRSLSELAKERRLGRLTGTGATVVTTPEPEPTPAGTATASSGPSASSAAARRSGMLRVEDVQDNGAVMDGRVSVYGTVRNTGRVPLCRVRIFLRLYDDTGVLLSTGETTTDLKTVAAGETVAFGGTVKAPAGLRGSSERKPDPLVDGPSATNWRRVGRIQAEVIDARDECT